MRIAPREDARLLLHRVGFLAQKRLARGLRLNRTEATALIASQLQERICDGKQAVVDLVQHGKTLLGRRHVYPNVVNALREIQVEGTSVNGVFLVTVHDPICTEDGNLEAALYGSFLPIPSQDLFPVTDVSEYAREKQPGAVIVKNERIGINADRKRLKLRFQNNGDRSIQVAQVAKGVGHLPEPGASAVVESGEMDSDSYAAMFGPTTGDRVRLGDTELWIEVERDATIDGDKVKPGGGKTILEGMSQELEYSRKTLDLLITNVLIVDWTGIYKADIGVKDGLIHGIGKAGNPDDMADVSPALIVGSSTEVVAGEKLIITAGAIDAHVHFICPQQVTEALASGTTTMIGGGTGPSAGTNATTCTPSPFYMRHMLAATDSLPMNFAFTGKGNDAGPTALEEIVIAGAAGLKLHEDWGTTPAAISNCLDVGDKFDVQVNIHTDTLNESGFVETTIAAFGNRTIHTYHTEGAGGGHAPDIIVVCEQPNVLPSSTNPTRPYTNNTLDEHLDMLMVCHHLDKSIPEDLAFAESRIRAETVAAEDVLHDIGAISMISSDSQAMGRVGEVISRTWRTASKMREFCGPLTALGDRDGVDNGRVKRYVAKYTINPAITHGISHLVGQVAVGTLADLVLWKPENFGAKPEMVLKSGVIVWSQMGDSNASTPAAQPFIGRTMWGSSPASAALNSVAFLSEISITSGTIASYGLSKRFEAVKGCRKVSKKDMKWNDAMPKMTVDPESYVVTADGVHATVPPAQRLPLSKNYNLF